LQDFMYSSRRIEGLRAFGPASEWCSMLPGADEHEALERSLLAEGCRDALVLWRDVLIDGHNRYAICSQHGIPFRTVQNDSFESIEDVMLWMIDNQLARRSVSDFQRGLLALRKKEIVAARVAQKMADDRLQTEADQAAPAAAVEHARGSGQGRACRQYHQPDRADPEGGRAGTGRGGAQRADLDHAAANVASLPREAQVAAVAGGKKELQQAARQVREQKAGARKPKKLGPPDARSTDQGPEGPGRRAEGPRRHLMARTTC
jgi:hypothetical protein